MLRVMILLTRSVRFSLERTFMPLRMANAQLPALHYWLLGLLTLSFLGAARNSASGPTLLSPVGVTSALSTTKPIANAQSYLTFVGVERWHKLGYRGQGCKVAVLDSGFRGYREFLGKGLPAFVTAKSFRTDHSFEARDSQHGILCAEVIHTLAPAAQNSVNQLGAGRPHVLP